MRTFVIGDLHGCRDELSKMWEHLISIEKFDIFQDTLIFIGDYVDRGPDSKGVIDFCLDLKKIIKKIVFLKGNHEDMFMDFLGLKGQHGNSYLHNGGKLTFESYKKSIDWSGDFRMDGSFSQSFRSKLRTLLPITHIEFLNSLELYHETDKFIYVHAGVDPDYSWENQRDEDLMWQRDYFYQAIKVNNNHAKFGNKTFIHGHTPVGPEFDLPYRINVDGACVFDGFLICLEVNEVDPANSKIYKIRKNASRVQQYFAN